jgi:hypothetical protein
MMFTQDSMNGQVSEVMNWHFEAVGRGIQEVGWTQSGCLSRRMAIFVPQILRLNYVEFDFSLSSCLVFKLGLDCGSHAATTFGS